MKKKIYLAFGFFLSLAWSESAQAQQKIGSNPGTLHPGAILELESSNRGFLLPRISIANLSTWGLNGTATDGMMVFNTNATTGTGYYVWSGSAWTRIFTGTLNTATTNVLDYNTTSRILTSTVNGVAASSAALPLATSSETGLLSNTDWSTFNAKENALTFANGLTRTTNAITLGGTLTDNTSLTLGANSFTFGGATTGKVIVSGPAGSSTSGLQLSNLLTAVTPATATASQRVLTVDGSGNVILGTDFGSNNAGTVTNVTGTAPINVTSGNTTPVISINALGITSDLIADGAITGAKLAAGAISAANLADGAITSDKILDGAITAAKLNSMSATTGQVLNWNGTTWAPTTIIGPDGDAWGVTGEDQNSSIFRNGNVGIGVAPRESFDIRKGFAFHTGGNLGMFWNAYYDGGLKYGGYGGSNFSGTIDFSPSSGDMYFNTSIASGTEGANVTERNLLSLRQSGLVGVGTTNPFEKLDLRDGVLQSKQTLDYGVAGSRDLLILGLNKSHGNFGSISSYVWQAEKEANGGSIKLNLLAQAADGTYGSNYDNASVTRTNVMTFFNGNVGIGTSTPSSSLQVETPSSINQRTLLLLEPNSWGNTTNMESSYLIRAGEGVKSNVNGLGVFAVRGDGQGYFTGNLGVGTSSPGAKLAVNGTSHLFGLVSTAESIELGGLGSGDRSTYIDFHGQDGVDYSARIIRDPGANGVFNIINGSSLLTLNTTGNVGIGTTSPSAKLEVAGQVKITGGAPGAGKVLTSDADGLASWVTPSTSNLAIRRVTAATTVTSTDHTIIANAFDAGYTITLPAPSASTGQILVIRKVDESSNAITFTFAGITATNAIRVSDTSASAGAYMNTLNYNRTIRIQSDGTDWYLLD